MTAAAGAVRRVCVVGSGSFGTAVACVAAAGATSHPGCFDAKVSLWARRADLVKEINSEHKNSQYWPGTLPDNVVAVADVQEAASGAGVCVVAVPADFLASVLPSLRTALPLSCIIVSVLKSLRIEDGVVVPYVRHLAAELPGRAVAALMGPNLYKDMARGEFAEATLGLSQVVAADVLCKLFNTPLFCVRHVSDVEAVDLCGCMKNTVTIACGFAEGLGWGGNARAAIMRRGLLEIVAFLREFLPADRPGALDPQSVALEACGVGDLILSCTSGRGRALAAEFVKHQGKRKWDELERECMGVMRIPDLHNVQHVHGLLASKGRLHAYPVLARTYAIAFGGIDQRKRS